nr:MAG TPA: hypothetical protein [Caudoviricetes sp.]
MLFFIRILYIPNYSHCESKGKPHRYVLGIFRIPN